MTTPYRNSGNYIEGLIEKTPARPFSLHIDCTYAIMRSEEEMDWVYSALVWHRQIQRLAKEEMQKNIEYFL